MSRHVGRTPLPRGGRRGGVRLASTCPVIHRWTLESFSVSTVRAGGLRPCARCSRLACCSSIVSTPPAPTGPHGLQRAPVATMHTRIRIRRARCAGEAVRTPVPETARLTRDARQADSHGARTRLAPARARSRREHISSGCGRRFRGALRHAPRLLRPAPRRPAAALVSCSSPP